MVTRHMFPARRCPHVRARWPQVRLSCAAGRRAATPAAAQPAPPAAQLIFTAGHQSAGLAHTRRTLYRLPGCSEVPGGESYRSRREMMRTRTYSAVWNLREDGWWQQWCVALWCAGLSGEYRGVYLPAQSQPHNSIPVPVTELLSLPATIKTILKGLGKDFPQVCAGQTSCWITSDNSLLL